MTWRALNAGADRNRAGAISGAATVANDLVVTSEGGAYGATLAVYRAALLADTLPRGWVFTPKTVGRTMSFSIATAATVIYLR